MTLDPCCPLCRSGTGVCLTRRTCDHHQAAAARQRIEDRRPTISYRDPTGNTAVNNITRTRRTR